MQHQIRFAAGLAAFALAAACADSPVAPTLAPDASFAKRAVYRLGMRQGRRLARRRMAGRLGVFVPVLIGMGAVVTGILNSYQQFTVPAIAPLRPIVTANGTASRTLRR